MSTEDRQIKSLHTLELDWKYRCLWNTIWVLWIKPATSGRTASALDIWFISPASWYAWVGSNIGKHRCCEYMPPIASHLEDRTWPSSSLSSDSYILFTSSVMFSEPLRGWVKMSCLGLSSQVLFTFSTQSAVSIHLWPVIVRQSFLWLRLRATFSWRYKHKYWKRCLVLCQFFKQQQ